jgi:hypothetical protein
MSRFERIEAFIEEEVKIQLNRYAQIISKRHDISLHLLLQDLGNLSVSVVEDEQKRKKGQCLGITATKKQCKTSGKHEGYCFRHVLQKPVKKSLNVATDDGIKHVGHALNECLFLPGCPACDKQSPKLNLLIDI